MSKLISQFMSQVMPGVVRPLRVLWNEVIGVLFLTFAVWFAPTAIRNCRAFEHGHASLFQALAPAGFTLVMAYFGVTSFLRARKIGRS